MCILMVAEKYLYVLLWLAENTRLHAFMASRKTSCKFCQANCKPEKFGLVLYLTQLTVTETVIFLTLLIQSTYSHLLPHILPIIPASQCAHILLAVILLSPNLTQLYALWCCLLSSFICKITESSGIFQCMLCVDSTLWILFGWIQRVHRYSLLTVTHGK